MGLALLDFQNPLCRVSARSACPLQRAGALVVLLLFIAGCNTPMQTPRREIWNGDYDEALALVEDEIVDDRSQRRYMLGRMRAGVLAMDAGRPIVAERWFSEVYDVLRTQGLNADKTVSSVVLTEGIKIWKGEPFEQALALAYYALVQGSQGSWDNTRAASANALFYLRDFGDFEDTPQRMDTQGIVERALEYERQQYEREHGRSADAADDEPTGDEYINHGYVAERSNFTLAYLLHAIASQQLDRPEEADDFYHRVIELEPGMRETVERFRSGEYNTVLVVAYGLGPIKEQYGMDGALARFVPRTPSERSALNVSTPAWSFQSPIVSDINAMAQDHMWNNMEDVRIAKSVIGNLLLVGGAVTLGEAIEHNSEAGVWTGAALLASGLYLKATAGANTDYCDVFPQRFYVVPLNITSRDQRIDLGLGGHPGVVTLTDWEVPIGPDAQLVQVRLPAMGAGQRIWSAARRGR